jgi:hypothetical protein
MSTIQHAKWVYLGQRNPRLSRAAFLQRWLKHRTMGAPPEMGAEFVTADYCAVAENPPALAGISTEYDAAGLFALASLGAIPLVARFLKTDYIQADEKRFFNTTSENFSMFCVEDVVRDGEYTKTVVIQFLRRAAALGPTEFTRQWRERHGGLALDGLPGLSRYVQNTVVALPPPGFGYDGIAELWFDTPESATAAAGVLDGMMTDATLIDVKNTFCLLTDVIISRPGKSETRQGKRLVICTTPGAPNAQSIQPQSERAPSKNFFL